MFHPSPRGAGARLASATEKNVAYGSLFGNKMPTFRFVLSAGATRSRTGRVEPANAGISKALTKL
jgi:hypothetical protein